MPTRTSDPTPARPAASPWTDFLQGLRGPEGLREAMVRQRLEQSRSRRHQAARERERLQARLDEIERHLRRLDQQTAVDSTASSTA